MNLGEVIAFLKKQDKDIILKDGFLMPPNRYYRREKMMSKSNIVTDKDPV